MRLVPQQMPMRSFYPSAVLDLFSLLHPDYARNTSLVDQKVVLLPLQHHFHGLVVTLFHLLNGTDQ